MLIVVMLNVAAPSMGAISFNQCRVSSFILILPFVNLLNINQQNAIILNVILMNVTLMNIVLPTSNLVRIIL